MLINDPNGKYDSCLRRFYVEEVKVIKEINFILNISPPPRFFWKYELSSCFGEEKVSLICDESRDGEFVHTFLITFSRRTKWLSAAPGDEHEISNVMFSEA